MKALKWTKTEVATSRGSTRNVVVWFCPSSGLLHLFDITSSNRIYQRSRKKPPSSPSWLVSWNWFTSTEKRLETTTIWTIQHCRHLCRQFVMTSRRYQACTGSLVTPQSFCCGWKVFAPPFALPTSPSFEKLSESAWFGSSPSCSDFQKITIKFSRFVEM